MVHYLLSRRSLLGPRSPEGIGEEKNMDIKNFVDCAKRLDADISVLMRGDHGIGKSQVARQLAAHFDLPLIDKRLSQMSEGDMIGLPKLDDDVTRFCHPDWYVQACEAPVVLFLDELNRATGEVMNAGFQIVLDRELNGMKLHEGTRVYAAVNTGGNYQVNDIDPALLDRFWVVDLHPTTEDWLEWAKGPGGIHPYLVSFVQSNPNALRPGSAKSRSGDKDSSPRSMERLDRAFRKNGLYDADMAGATNPTRQVAYLLAMGFVGSDVANLVTDFLKNMERQVTAGDILDRWDAKLERKLRESSQEKWNICIERIVDHTHKEMLDEKQAENLGKFMGILPGELKVSLWTNMAKEPNQFVQANIKIIHPHVMEQILEVFGKKVPQKKGK